MAGGKWPTKGRRGRDSNPRYSCPYNGFRDRPDRPLRHLSFLWWAKISWNCLKKFPFRPLLLFFVKKRKAPAGSLYGGPYNPSAFHPHFLQGSMMIKSKLTPTPPFPDEPGRGAGPEAELEGHQHKIIMEPSPICPCGRLQFIFSSIYKTFRKVAFLCTPFVKA